VRRKWSAFSACGGTFDEDSLKEQLAEVDAEAQDPDIWSDQDRARQVMSRRSQLQQQISTAESLIEAHEELEVLMEMAREGEEGADAELGSALKRISPLLDRVELTAKMTGERRGFDVEVMDEQPGEEAGIKGATLLVKGAYAYGNLRSENGVHRLVRISPFDSQSRRHTSFASAHIYPEVDDAVDLEIPEKDIRVDRYCSSGPGGQGVNTTYSAVRVVHEPSGVIVTCQNERSQIKNLASAMKVLKARLYELEMQKREEELKKLKGPKKDISWGNQIRSYVLQPYRMVKDLRTEHEVGNADRVLDGDIDDFIEAFLHWNAQQEATQ
jgi:peptide chain release factor 2